MITTEMIKQLREKTGAGVMDCKEALTDSNGDTEKAIIYLRKKGLAEVKEREPKSLKEGCIGVYSHVGGRIVSIVEILCETDFSSRGPEFQQFAHDIALHISAANPQYVGRDQVPQSILDREKEIIEPILKGKPAAVAEKIIAGKLSKVFKEMCLLEQIYVKDPNITISDLLVALSTKIKEKIIIKRFVRFVVGE